MSKTDAMPAADRGSECNDLLGPTVADVFAKMRAHRPNWNAYGQSRESTADLACRCALELAAAYAARAVAAERERWVAKAGKAYTDAHAIFNDPPSETPQVVRDVIEWHLSTMRASEGPNAKFTGP